MTVPPPNATPPSYDAAVAADRFTDHRMPRGSLVGHRGTLPAGSPPAVGPEPDHALAGYLQTVGPLLLDVGGGAGRISLALAEPGSRGNCPGGALGEYACEASS